MIVVCIDNCHRHNYLVRNKSYEVLSFFVGGYEVSSYSKKNFRVMCEDGRIRWELKSRFIPLDEYRVLQLDKVI
jgi:hypothetical protein